MPTGIRQSGIGHHHVGDDRRSPVSRVEIRPCGMAPRRPGGCSRQARLPRESQEWLLRPGSKRSWIIHHTPVQCQEVNEAAIAPFRAIRPGPGGSQGAGGAGSRPSSGCSQPPGGSSHIVDGPGHIQPKLYGQIMSKQALIHATWAVCAPPGRMSGCPGHRAQGLTSWHCTPVGSMIQDLLAALPAEPRRDHHSHSRHHGHH